MEVRADRRLLLVNYLITFALVGWVLHAVHSPEHVRQNWYDPEYTSHMSGNYGKLSCTDCHIQPFAAAEMKTCWTAGCHGHFDPENPPAGMKLLTKDEMGRDKPNWGAQLAFHMEASKKMSCEACHPSHRLPTRGAFNKSTIQAAMQQANLPPMSARTAAVYAAKKLEIFHAGARRFVEDVNNCSSCHVAPQNAIHLGAASQSCLSCHADVTSWKTARVAPNQLGALFEGHPLLPKVEEVPGESDGWSDPRHKWIAGFRP